MLFAFITTGNSSAVRTFLLRNNWNIPVYLMDAGSASTYMMKGVPATYIISRRGNTVMRRIGSQRWDSPDVKQFIDAQLDAAP